MISNLYVNGDSYSESYTPYSKFLAERLNVPVTNHAIRGSSNDRIIRSTIEYILSNPPKDTLFLIGFSFITREELWASNYKNIRVIDTQPGSRFTTIQTLLTKDLDNSTKEKIANIDINKNVIHFYYNLYMLSRLIKSLNYNYLFFSAANNTDWGDMDWDFLSTLGVYKAINSDPNIVNIHNFSIPGWAKENKIDHSETGHLYQDGHKKFADYLVDQLKIKGFI
jgi:hypothetical protein